ncbi:MAG TPA: hypothetical protein VF377_01485 [Acidimicrobiia bacterium]
MKSSISFRVGLVGLVVGVLAAVQILVAFEWDPAAFVKFGEEDPVLLAYAEQWIGEDVLLAPALGHDGKFFFMQAMDPFYLEPGKHAAFLDRPAYRAQRMLYPTLASLGGLLDSRGVQWGLVIVNVLALCIGTYFTARVAQLMGGPAWLGLAFALNPGLLSEIAIDGGGVVATAGLMAGVFGILRRNTWWAVLGFTAGALARETMILAAVGVIGFQIWKQKKLPGWPWALPFAAVGCWWVFLRLRLEEGLGQDLQAVDLPLVGFVKAMRRWMTGADLALDMALGLLILAVCVVVLYRALTRPTVLGASVAGLAALALLMSEPVWYRYFDSSRAVAPVLTAFIVMTITRGRRGSEEAAKPALTSHD